MNMPPECICAKDPEQFGPCNDALLTVFNKTKCTHRIICMAHLDNLLSFGPTYVIYPAKDYSIHGGHDLPAKRKDT